MKITDEQWSIMSRACEGSEFEDVQFINAKWFAQEKTFIWY
jgi:hypothetical protein